MALVRGYAGLEALPLEAPVVRTPIGFMVVPGARPSRALEAAMALAQDPPWLHHVAAEGGLLEG
jgi:hypothetical protein